MKGVFLISMFMGLASIVEAGQIITYTGQALGSQEEANNEALQGVAKQISSRVKSSETLIKEQVEDNVSVYYYSVSNISANVKLKGVTITPLEKDGKFFRAKATLDLDDLTADIRFQLKTIQEDVSSSEKNISDYLGKRLYNAAITELEKCKQWADQHAELLKQLAKIYPLNDDLRLKSNLKNLEKQLIENLSFIKMTLNADSTIAVSDKKGSLGNFTLICRQGKKTVFEGATDENGILKLPSEVYGKDEAVKIEPKLSLSVAQKTHINPITIAPQKIESTTCKIQVACHEDKAICDAMQSILTKEGLIASAADEGILTYTFSYSATERGAVGSVVSYDCVFNFRDGTANFDISTKCVGKNQQDAVIKSLKKANFKKFKQFVEKSCPEPEPEIDEEP